MTDGADRGPTQQGVLDEHEGAQLAELLAALGVDERPARIIGFLAVEGHGRSADIEHALDMRQPEVSQATKALRERGWVVARPEKTPGKGRPVNDYHLDVTLLDIVNEVEARRREEINEELDRIAKLRSIVEAAAETVEASDAPAREPPADADAEPTAERVN